MFLPKAKTQKEQKKKKKPPQNCKTKPQTFTSVDVKGSGTLMWWDLAVPWGREAARSSAGTMGSGGNQAPMVAVGEEKGLPKAGRGKIVGDSSALQVPSVRWVPSVATSSRGGHRLPAHRLLLSALLCRLQRLVRASCHFQTFPTQGLAEAELNFPRNGSMRQQGEGLAVALGNHSKASLLAKAHPDLWSGRDFQSFRKLSVIFFFPSDLEIL